MNELKTGKFADLYTLIFVFAVIKRRNKRFWTFHCNVVFIHAV